MRINLRYIKLSADLVAKTLLVNGDEHKKKALDVLGIVPRGDETPMQSWLRAMCEENGLKYSQPVPREIADAIVSNVNAARFMWAMA